jgi:chromosome partitioning protein
VTESQDDLASRGRAIFQRLRGSEPGPPPENADEPAADAATPEAVDEVVEPDLAEGAPSDAALSDEELEAFTTPPPPDRPEPTNPPVRGPLPGLEDLPPLEPDAAGSPDLEAPPIYVPLEEAEEALEPPPPAPDPEPAPAAPVAEEVPDDDVEVESPAAFARPLPRVMAIANQKGGVGKTTTAVNLGACLADLGYRVLVVDLDPQGNASTGLGINIRDLHGSMYDVILHDLPIEDCVEATSVRNLFCAPSSLDLAGAEIELVPAFSRELRLKKALLDVRDDYDFVLIDCPPSLGLLTVNGLAAASEVVVPIQCEYYALEGLGQLLRNVNLVQKNLNPTLEVSAIILVMYDARTKLADQVVGEVRDHFGPKVCKNVVPRTVRLSEAPSFGQPIIAFDPSSRGAIAYRELAREVSGGTPQRAG